MVEGMGVAGLPLLVEGAAVAAGWAGFALVAGWPAARGRRALLGLQGASAAAFALHYSLSGAATGAAMAALSLVQVLAAWRDPRPCWARALYVATLPALAVLLVTTWAGWPSACAALGLALGTVARWQTSTAALRLLFLASAGCWAVHDVLVSSLPGLLADLVCAVLLVHGWRRDACAAVTAA